MQTTTKQALSNKVFLRAIAKNSIDAKENNSLAQSIVNSIGKQATLDFNCSIPREIIRHNR